MRYGKAIRQISLKEGISKKEIEREIQLALNSANMNCSPHQFVELITEYLKKTIYSKIV